MRAARSLEPVRYLLEMTEAEASELSQFLGDRMRARKPDGTPQIEVQVRNELSSVGLRSRTLSEEYSLED